MNNVKVYVDTKTILIVDDDIRTVTLFESIIKIGGYQHLSAMDGHTALDIIADYPVDLVLLDVRMPEFDGYRVCEEIKGNPHTAHIPVIFVTAIGDQLDYNRADAVGVDEILLKPISHTTLLAVIQRYI